MFQPPLAEAGDDAVDRFIVFMALRIPMMRMR
jgi:hypothetical protein